MKNNFVINGTDKTSTEGSNTEVLARTRKAEFMTKLKDVDSLLIATVYRIGNKNIPKSFRDQTLSSSQVNCTRILR